VALVVFAVALAWHPAWGKGLPFNPIPPNVDPHWEPFPGIPGILYSKVLEHDVFQYQGKYYLFMWDEYYQASKPGGPWQQIKSYPPIFNRLRPQDFKFWWKQKEAPQFYAPPSATPGR
jgi:hypothetical protein